VSKKGSTRSAVITLYGVLLLLMVPFGLMCSGLVLFTEAMVRPATLALCVLLATATAVPYGALLLWLDRNEREPWWLLLGAFLWGATVATTYASIVNSLTAFVGGWVLQDEALGNMAMASISAPISEEITKGMAVVGLLLLFRRELDNILDGLVYGAVVGLGFAWFENITYYLAVANEGFIEVFFNAFGRGVLNGLSGHPTFTALTGLAVGLIRVQRRGTVRWLWLPLGLGLAMFSHFVWNTFAGLFFISEDSLVANHLVSWPLAVVVLQLPFVLLLGLVLWFVWRHEDAIIVGSLLGEPSDVVKEGEAEALVPARKRAGRGWDLLQRSGFAAYRRQRKLERLQIDLAFARWHHSEEGEGSLDEDPTLQRLRERIRALR